MTSAPTIQTDAAAVAAVEDPYRALRLRMKSKAAANGFVDGGWWPRSRDLAVELPGCANTDDVEALLASRRIVRGAGLAAAAEDEAESAQQRWELDGGHL